MSHKVLKMSYRLNGCESDDAIEVALLPYITDDFRLLLFSSLNKKALPNKVASVARHALPEQCFLNLQLRRQRPWHHRRAWLDGRRTPHRPLCTKIQKQKLSAQKIKTTYFSHFFELLSHVCLKAMLNCHLVLSDSMGSKLSTSGFQTFVSQRFKSQTGDVIAGSLIQFSVKLKKNLITL